MGLAVAAGFVLDTEFVLDSDFVLAVEEMDFVLVGEMALRMECLSAAGSNESN